MAAKNEKAPTFISAITIAVIAKNRASAANNAPRVVVNAISNILRFAWLMEHHTAVIAAFIAHQRDEQRIDINGDARNAPICVRHFYYPLFVIAEF